MTVKITEHFGNEESTEQKYDKRCDKRAFYYGGKIFIFDGKDYLYYAKEGRDGDSWLSDTANFLVAKGFTLSSELQHRKEEQEENLKQREAQQKQHEAQHLAAKKAEAARTGKPQVVSSSPYNTTASVGRNYLIVMQNGDTIDVTNGCPTSSHATRCGTTDHDDEIQSAIADYLARLN